MKPSLVVMAAGIGSRYGGLKQIEPVGPSGEIIIDYSVFDAVQAGFGKVVFIIRRDIEKDFKSAVGSHFEGRVPVEYAFQEIDKLPSGFSAPAGRVKPWGTGHAILCSRDLVREPFAVINADDFYGRSAYVIIHDYLAKLSPDATDYAMVGYAIRNTLSPHGSVTRGLCSANSEGMLKNVVELFKVERADTGARFQDAAGAWQQLTGNETASMNLFGFTPAIFSQLEDAFPEFLQTVGKTDPKAEFLLPALVDKFINAGLCRMKILSTDEKWFGVTYKEDKPEVASNIQRLVESGVYPKKLWP